MLQVRVKKKTLSIQKLAYLQSSLQLTSNNRNPQWIQQSCFVIKLRYICCPGSVYFTERTELCWSRKTYLCPRCNLLKKTEPSGHRGSILVFLLSTEKQELQWNDSIQFYSMITNTILHYLSLWFPPAWYILEMEKLTSQLGPNTSYRSEQTKVNDGKITHSHHLCRNTDVCVKNTLMKYGFNFFVKVIVKKASK